MPLHKDAIRSRSGDSLATDSAMSAIPAFPGAAITSGLDGDSTSTRAKACSRPPDSITKHLGMASVTSSVQDLSRLERVRIHAEGLFDLLQQRSAIAGIELHLRQLDARHQQPRIAAQRG